MEKSGQLHDPATLPPRKNPHTLWIRGWVVPEPAWTFQRREKSHVSTGVQNMYLAACSIVTIAHSFTQTAQWTKTSNKHTLHVFMSWWECRLSVMCPILYLWLDGLNGRIKTCMYNVLYIVCCYANSPRWYVELFLYCICLSCGLYLKLLYLQLTPVLSNIIS